MLFVILAIYFIVFPIIKDGYVSSFILLTCCIVLMVFFGSISLYSIKKLTSKKSGLIINNKGITDNSSALAVGFIPWRDIIEIKIAQVKNQKFVILIVKNPEHYINRFSNILSKSVLKLNLKGYDSPVSIAPNSLKTNFEELHQLIVEQFELYKI